MPAGYCLTINDYICRAFVKYPALVYHNLWWGPFNEFSDGAETGSDPDTIPIGLTCRILPDSEFPSEDDLYHGAGTCKSLCNVTDEELKDVTDNRPLDSDCLNSKGESAQWHAGGFHPLTGYGHYIEIKKAKCWEAFK